MRGREDEPAGGKSLVTEMAFRVARRGVGDVGKGSSRTVEHPAHVAAAFLAPAHDRVGDPRRSKRIEHASGHGLSLLDGENDSLLLAAFADLDPREPRFLVSGRGGGDFSLPGRHVGKLENAVGRSEVPAHVHA